jgi:uncharacterized membrane protein
MTRDDSSTTGKKWWQRFVPHPYTVPGLIGAIAFACLSFTPSLLPRGGLVQGLITGVSAAIGYGVGLLFAVLWREFADREARTPQPRTWKLLIGIGAIALLGFVAAGQQWQGDVRDLMGVEAPGPMWIVQMPITAIVAFVLLVALGRALRTLGRWIASVLTRWIGARAARGVGIVAVSVLAILTVNGVLIDGFISAADSTFAVRNQITPDGVEQPTTPLRTSGPGSDLTWEQLGREGRKFIAGGPTADQIEDVMGGTAEEPIRAYGGLEVSRDPEVLAELAVADLERAGGFDRAALMVATTTGSGWLDPASVETFEYLNRGDTAIVGMQYSYLPSWISYLVDQERARDAGRALFDAVYEKWAALPADERPELYVFGESLGSFGGETAFSGERDLSTRTDGAVFAGPPNFNVLWSQFVAGRDEGTREVAPTYRDGRIVRFTENPSGGFAPEGQPWDGTRVAYLQHASDPIVWWSPSLVFNDPDWLNEEPGSDVVDDMRWAPFVTFWQVTGDLPFATGVPDGHGHRYSGEYVDAWEAVLQTEATAAQLDELRAIATEAR